MHRLTGLKCLIACSMFLASLDARAQCRITTPIIIDLDDNGFDLTGLDNPVRFDLDADGAINEVGWTSPGTRDAFLALDRNRNGQIDDGSELFGNNTLLMSGKSARHGFQALAEFDRRELGGNRDGAITEADSIWPSLLLWIDDNHNGRSETQELQGLSRGKLIRLETEFKLSRRDDEHGNRFRYLSKAWRSGKKNKVRAIRSVDVILVTR